MSGNKIKPVYPEVDHMQLDKDGGYYCRHVAAMTDEGLHRKSDIAGQLGMRDREIDRLIAAGDRVVSAFRALGETRDIVSQVHRHHECEASMLALAEAVDKAKGGGA